MKYASLHRSYAAPVRVCAIPDVTPSVAARATILPRVTAPPPVVARFVIVAVRDDVVRADTVLRDDTRDGTNVTPRCDDSERATVDTRDCPVFVAVRDAPVPSRTAACATHMPMAITAKIRIFFISD